MTTPTLTPDPKSTAHRRRIESHFTSDFFLNGDPTVKALLHNDGTLSVTIDGGQVGTTIYECYEGQLLELLEDLKAAILNPRLPRAAR